MAYLALARKWRPRNFGEVVGQEHVVKALTHALEHARLHHAYLFTGARGVGKTTLARILAKAMNCDALKGCEPCGECLMCREVDEGRCVDLIEVDAASRTKVEDTRDLLENVQYAPGQGRYKIYLIDEVHMLSGHSFNALLKTLEEPPPHVKFLLATTDPQKIPVTVLSRCLQFNLKLLNPEQIRAQMEFILEREGVEFERNAVRSLARAAAGAMRDGLSLLDQAIAHGGGRLDDAQVGAMLGAVARKPVFELLEALAAGDAGVLLHAVAAMAEHAPDYADALQQMLIALHHLALAQWAPDIVKHEEDADRLMDLARRMSREDVQLYYQIGLLGQRDLPLAPEPRGGFEMTLLRMLAFKPAVAAGELPSPAPSAARKAPEAAKPPARAERGEARPLAQAREMLGAAPHKSRVPQDAPGVEPARVPDAAPPERPAPPPWTEEGDAAEPQPNAAPVADWSALIQKMRLAGMTLQLAHHCTLVAAEETRVTLNLDPQAANLRTPQLEAKLEQALRAHFKNAAKLVIQVAAPQEETPAARIQRDQEERQRAAEKEIERDPTVLALKERFDARIVPGSVKPLD
jgi:DNA polymerase-3 subunit gamma/tau